MKKKVGYLIHTEYHLMLSLINIIDEYSNTEEFEVTLILKRNSKSERLKQSFVFDFLPYQVRMIEFELNLDKLLTQTEKNVLNEILNIQFNTFIFFQEHDPITIILINKYVENKTKIYLFQDGLKPYVMNSMKFSLGLVLNDIKQNLWIRKNEYPVNNYFSFINCKKYGFLKGIDKLFLTFPNAYDNWNNLQIEKIEPKFTNNFKEISQKVFSWNNTILKDKENIIFYMNQPLHDDGTFELNLLQRLQKKHEGKKLYIKNHPLTPNSKIQMYNELKNTTIIDSKIPAELFICDLKNSIVLSIASTSMLINNESCRFYWVHNIKEKNNIKRLERYNIVNPTNHIIEVTTIEEII